MATYKSTTEEIRRQNARALAQAKELGLDPAFPPPEIGAAAPLPPPSVTPLTHQMGEAPGAIASGAWTPGPDDVLDYIRGARGWQEVLFGTRMLKAGDFEDGGLKPLAQVQKIAENGERTIDVPALGRGIDDAMRPHVKRQARVAPVSAIGEMDEQVGSELADLDRAIRQAQADMTVQTLDDPEFMEPYRKALARRRELMSEQGKRRGRQFEAELAEEWRQFQETEAAAREQSQRQMGAIDVPKRGEMMTPEQRAFWVGLYQDLGGLSNRRSPRVMQIYQMLAADTELRGGPGRAATEAERAEHEGEATEEMIERGYIRTPEGAWERAEPRMKADIKRERLDKEERVASLAAKRKQQKAAKQAARKVAAAEKKAARLAKTPAGRAAAAKATAEGKALVRKVAEKLGDVEVDRAKRTLETANVDLKDAKTNLAAIKKEGSAVQAKITAMVEDALGVTNEAELRAKKKPRALALFSERDEIFERHKEAQAEVKRAKSTRKDADDNLYQQQLQAVHSMAAGVVPTAPAARGAPAARPAGVEPAPREPTAAAPRAAEARLPGPVARRAPAPTPAGAAGAVVNEIKLAIDRGEEPRAVLARYAGLISASELQEIVRYAKMTRAGAGT